VREQEEKEQKTGREIHQLHLIRAKHPIRRR
jgi:hypothetical protein